MTGAFAGASIGGMTSGEATLTIRLEPSDGPISGVLVAGGRERGFSGWIQLAGLIEELRPYAESDPDAGSVDPLAVPDCPSEPRESSPPR